MKYFIIHFKLFINTNELLKYNAKIVFLVFCLIFNTVKKIIGKFHLCNAKPLAKPLQ